MKTTKAVKIKVALGRQCFVLLALSLLLSLLAVTSGAYTPAIAAEPDTSLRLNDGAPEIVFHNGIPADCQLAITTPAGTQQRTVVSEGGGLAFVPLGVPPSLLQKTLDQNQSVHITVSSPGRNIAWALEPLLVFNARTPGLPMASAKADDSQSTGTLEAGGASALAKLSYAGVGNNYVLFPLNLPLPADALAVGGFFRRDPKGTVKPLFSFRVTDSRGKTYGYFTPEPTADTMQMTWQPLAHSQYSYGGPNTTTPPQPPLVLNALLFDSSDHKQAGTVQAQVSNLFVLRQTRFDIAPTAPLPRPSLVTVDFATPAPMPSMSGFLHAASDTQPTDERLLPVHPALWRIGYMWMQNRDRLAKLGIPTILVLSDSWGSKVPQDDADWEDYVKKFVGYAGGRRYTWDLWNEPDLSQFWKGTPAQFFHNANLAAATLRAGLGPDTIISGPSISHYNRDYLTKFLDSCKVSHTRLDVLSWHELDADSNTPAIAEHLREARRLFIDNPAYQSVGIKRIEINEIVGPSAQYRPGEILNYFYNLEQGGADGACKGCWDDNCGNNTLDGILTPDTHEPRAAWWAYKTYADSVAGRVHSQMSDPRLAVFASRAAAQPQAQIVVGYAAYQDYSPPTLITALRLQNVSRLPFVGHAKQVHVTVEKLPASEKAPLLAPEKVQETDLPLAHGALDMTLSPLGLHEAYLITLSRTGR